MFQYVSSPQRQRPHHPSPLCRASTLAGRVTGTQAPMLCNIGEPTGKCLTCSARDHPGRAAPCQMSRLFPENLIRALAPTHRQTHKTKRPRTPSRRRWLSLHFTFYSSLITIRGKLTPRGQTKRFVFFVIRCGA